MSVEELLDNLREGGDGVQMSLDAIMAIMRQQHHPRATFNREEMTVGEIAAILHHDDAEVQAAGCLAISQGLERRRQLRSVPTTRIHWRQSVSI